MRLLQIKRTLRTMALGGALAATAAAPAQFGLSGGIGEAFRPSFTSRDVQLAVQMLQLDDAQKFILETLYDDYDDEFNTGVEGFRQNVTSLRTKIDPNNPDPGQIMRVVFGTINQWRGESRHLADQLMEDLQGLLSDEQLEYWGSFNRKLFRLSTSRTGSCPARSSTFSTTSVTSISVRTRRCFCSRCSTSTNSSSTTPSAGVRTTCRPRRRR